ncbi:MAG: glycosyltransferase [Candidatus Omnitrophica bacterium]|nr:glycosyltransferase [Candidatus Omnitrophota bacterium]
MLLNVAVIIPVKGDAGYLPECVRSILANTYPHKEITIVDDGLTSKAREALNEFSAAVKILDSQGKGPSFARNAAAQATRADLLAFTDSDCIAKADWLEELVRGFAEFPGVIACGGIQKIPDDACAFEKKVFLFLQRCGFISEYVRAVKGSNIIPINHNASCNVMYKRDVFLKEGGFKAGLWPGEDVELDYRLKRSGYTLILNPAAIVYHYRPKDLKAFLTMMYRYGLAQGFLVRKYGLFRLMHFLPGAALGMLVVLPFVLPFNFFVSLLMLVCAGYAIVLLIFKFDGELTRIALSAFIYWNAGFFKGLIKPSVYKT